MVTGRRAGRASLTDLPDALRRRVIRGWLLAGGASDLTDNQIRGVDALVTTGTARAAWRSAPRCASQRLFAARRDGGLILHREPV